MLRVLAGTTLVAWVGATLLLTELRWFRRPSLSERLRPYVPAGYRTTAPLRGVETVSQLVGPVARIVGDRVSHLLGVTEDLQRRLRRVHSPLDVTGFRVRQLAWCLAGFGVGGLATISVRPPGAVALLLCLGVPLLAFLVQEQRLAKASARWQRRVFLELPVVAEQLAMLTTAGYSLVSALNRVALRGRGACADDLTRAIGRVSQGLTETEALTEWAQTVDVPAVNRLVQVLALNRQASNLAPLLSAEARSIRREVQRELVETMERRTQQVWIPVTVATLVPGVILISIPFLTALQTFRSI